MKTCNCHWIQALKGRDSGEEQRDELCQAESWKQEVAENWTGTDQARGHALLWESVSPEAEGAVREMNLAVSDSLARRVALTLRDRHANRFRTPSGRVEARGRGGCSGDESSDRRFVGAASRSDTEE